MRLELSHVGNGLQYARTSEGFAFRFALGDRPHADEDGEQGNEQKEAPDDVNQSAEVGLAARRARLRAHC